MFMESVEPTFSVGMVGGAKSGLPITCPVSPPEDPTKVSVESQRTDVGVQLCNRVEQPPKKAALCPLSGFPSQHDTGEQLVFKAKERRGVPEMKLGCWEESRSESSLDVV